LDEARLIRTSKFLSKHLRHQPARLGLTFEPGGWVEVEALLAACTEYSFALTHDELDEVVARNTYGVSRMMSSALASARTRAIALP
jgi:putative RNA 2'-phosphotransferase